MFPAYIRPGPLKHPVWIFKFLDCDYLLSIYVFLGATKTLINIFQSRIEARRITKRVVAWQNLYRRIRGKRFLFIQQICCGSNRGKQSVSPRTDEWGWLGDGVSKACLELGNMLGDGARLLTRLFDPILCRHLLYQLEIYTNCSFFSSTIKRVQTRQHFDEDQRDLKPNLIYRKIKRWGLCRTLKFWNSFGSKMGTQQTSSKFIVAVKRRGLFTFG